MASLRLHSGRIVEVDGDLIQGLSAHTWYGYRNQIRRPERVGVGVRTWVNLYGEIMGRAATGKVWTQRTPGHDYRRENIISVDEFSPMHKRSRSGYVGVSKRGERYRATLTLEGHQGETVYLGTFDEAYYAARVYDRALIEHGRAPVNFPEAEQLSELPEVSRRLWVKRRERSLAARSLAGGRGSSGGNGKGGGNKGKDGG